jgi:D-galactose 1-dehydrogenase
MQKIRIALVGVGKIARDQHIPALLQNPGFELVAAVSLMDEQVGVPHFATVAELLRSAAVVDAVVICTPPQVRFDIARQVLQQGLHVMLEKPPAPRLTEVQALVALAKAQGVALFAAWHCREAAGVEPARQWLASRALQRVNISWKEDVRVWHPGQAWIWQPGGMGVFDPGINALSIITRILPDRLVLRDANLVFPSNCHAPIRAQLSMVSSAGVEVVADLDFEHRGEPCWDIVCESDTATLQLSEGGAVLQIGEQAPVRGPDVEYPRLYRRFAQLVRDCTVDVDTTPLELVADAFLCGRRATAPAFIEDQGTSG